MIDDDDDDDRKPAWMRWGGAALGLAAAILIALWLRDVLLSGKPTKGPTVQQITLVRPPPPPPPKPPEQKPPEVKEEVKLEEQQPTPEPQKADAPPPGPDLAIDAEGTGSGDGFGLVGKKGGADLIGSGSGSGKGNPWAWYDALVNEAINAAFQAALAREKALKNKNYKVIVNVWVNADGQVTRTTLMDSTGDSNVDEILKNALKDMRALRDSPPSDMPQPMKIRVTSRA